MFYCLNFWAICLATCVVLYVLVRYTLSDLGSVTCFLIFVGLRYVLVSFLLGYVKLKGQVVACLPSYHFMINIWQKMFKYTKCLGNLRSHV